MNQGTDILVIGAGIVGVSTAWELQNRYPDSHILIIEKEKKAAIHQTGRNSGVIHAGIYYKPGSLKAQFCTDGLKTTYAFCEEHQLPVERCGKLIVATNDLEQQRLKDLYQRAITNNIAIESINQQELRTMEPNIRGVSAIFSPTTGITDYAKITNKILDLFLNQGGEIQYQQRLIRATEQHDKILVQTDKGHIEAQKVVVCAGLLADQSVSAFGLKPSFRIIPFRGDTFRLINQPENLVSRLIYPVPDPDRPFLGVHLTKKIGGGFTVGPNAALALKREGYNSRLDVSLRDIQQTLSYSGFWRLMSRHAGSAIDEMRTSLSNTAYLTKIHKYCDSINKHDLADYPSGIRAQAVTPDGKLVDDFLFQKGERSLHVCNAPSPAATSAMPIARHISDQLEQL